MHTNRAITIKKNLLRVKLGPQRLHPRNPQTSDSLVLSFRQRYPLPGKLSALTAESRSSCPRNPNHRCRRDFWPRNLNPRCLCRRRSGRHHTAPVAVDIPGEGKAACWVHQDRQDDKHRRCRWQCRTAHRRSLPGSQADSPLLLLGYMPMEVSSLILL